MCEILVAGAEKPVPFTRLEQWVLTQEKYGIAGWGWGVARLTDDGRLDVRRHVGKLAEDPDGLDSLRELESRRWVFHLRRPLRLPNIVEDMQPFYSDQFGFAYAHNGDFEKADDFRDQFDGLLAGSVDSEVGFRMTEKLIADGRELSEALDITLDTLGGTSNIALIYKDGKVLIYGKAKFNKLWRFCIDELECASTSLIFSDESFFDLVFDGLPTDRELVRGLLPLLPPVFSADTQ